MLHWIPAYAGMTETGYFILWELPKANIEILEGFLSELLHDDVRIMAILESEGNQET